MGTGQPRTFTIHKRRDFDQAQGNQVRVSANQNKKGTMKENHTVIEINGVKMEVDLRSARRIEEIRVGSRVKVLAKKYGDSYEVKHGVVIGFEPFKNLPTIIICTATVDYSEAKVEFLYYNAKSEGVEVVIANDDDLAALDKNDFLSKCDKEIERKKLEIAELENRKKYFLAKFNCYWSDVEQAVADATAP